MKTYHISFTFPLVSFFFYSMHEIKSTKGLEYCTIGFYYLYRIALYSPLIVSS